MAGAQGPAESQSFKREETQIREDIQVIQEAIQIREDITTTELAGGHLIESAAGAAPLRGGGAVSLEQREASSFRRQEIEVRTSLSHPPPPPPTVLVARETTTGAGGALELDVPAPPEMQRSTEVGFPVVPLVSLGIQAAVAVFEHMTERRESRAVGNQPPAAEEADATAQEDLRLQGWTLPEPGASSPRRRAPSYLDKPRMRRPSVKLEIPAEAEEEPSRSPSDDLPPLRGFVPKSILTPRERLRRDSVSPRASPRSARSLRRKTPTSAAILPPLNPASLANSPRSGRASPAVVARRSPSVGSNRSGRAGSQTPSPTSRARVATGNLSRTRALPGSPDRSRSRSASRK